MLDNQPDEAHPSPLSLTFEEAFTRLGAMVEILESGGLPLDQAAQMFEDGMALVRRCGQLLDETELRIAEIRENSAAQASTASAAPAGLSWSDLEAPPLDEEWEPEEDLPNDD